MFLFDGITRRGESGRRYKFKCVLTNKDLPPPGVGGVYLFVRRRWVLFLEVLYVGKAHELRSRLMGHEKWPRAFWYYGATERYVHGPILEENERRLVEADLIRGLKPRMNDQEIPNPLHNAAADRRKMGLFAWGAKPQRA
jgi:hypothetical protein